MTTMTMVFPYYVSVSEAEMWINLLIKKYHADKGYAVQAIGNDKLLINIEVFNTITDKEASGFLVGSARIARRIIKEALNG